MSARKSSLAALSGAVFALGWWVWIDGAVYTGANDDNVSVIFGHHLPGLFMTLALIMINAVSFDELNADSMSFTGSNVSTKARVWLFCSFIIAFASLISAIWIFIDVWAEPKDSKKPDSVWPGVALVLQNVLIFLSAIIYRFGPAGKSQDPSGL